MIYLDNAATTKVSPEVIGEMLPYLSEEYGNPGSIHSAGRRAMKAVDKARELCAEPISAEPENIIFTSGGSEANTLAIVGLAKYLKSIGKTHIITTQVEHHSVLNAVKSLFYFGFDATFIPVNSDGSLNVSDIEKEIKPETGLVSVMMVNNETGNRYDTYNIGALCHKRGILFHTDCVQSYCCTHIDVDESHIDFISASGHKIHAPKGVGILYARRKELLNPIIFGGSQEYELRGGTHNVPYIVAMGRASHMSYVEHLFNEHKYDVKIDRLRSNIIGEVSGVHINGIPHGNAKTINLRFDGVDGETLLLLLDNKGVAVSAGSACSAHYATPSHVLTALGLTSDEARSSIRISVSKYTTSEEIDIASKAIIDSVLQLRGG